MTFLAHVDWIWPLLAGGGIGGVCGLLFAIAVMRQNNADLRQLLSRQDHLLHQR